MVFFAASQVCNSCGHPSLILQIQADIPIQITLYYAVRYVLSSFDSPSSTRKSKAKSTSVLEATGLSSEQLQALDLDEYETTIASEIIAPSSMDTSFESIGGLDEIIASLRETVIYPLTFPELFAGANGLLGAPKGLSLSSICVVGLWSADRDVMMLRCVVVWSSRLWKDNVGKSTGEGKRGYIYQSSTVKSVSCAWRLRIQVGRERCLWLPWSRFKGC